MGLTDVLKCTTMSRQPPAELRRTQRKDIGVRHSQQRARTFKLEGPALDDLPAWRVEPVLKDGYLFKVTKGDTVGFYNDSEDHEMHVDVIFGAGSDIEALDGASKRAVAGGGVRLTQVLYPNETKMLFKGHVNGSEGSFTPKLLSDRYKRSQLAECESHITAEIEAVHAVATGGRGAGSSDADLLEACAARGVKFVDLSFPPTRASLQRGRDAESVDECGWRRPEEFTPRHEHGHLMGHHGPEPDDIELGRLGDAYLLCAAASLAEFPSKVADLFLMPESGARRKREEKVGGYHVTLCHGGWWRDVVVDDYLPVGGAGRPIFAHNVDEASELWVALLEKAYAKVHGSYAAIAAGDPLHAMSDLTGYPTERLDDVWQDALVTPDGVERLFAQLTRLERHKSLLIVRTPSAADAGATTSSEAQALSDMFQSHGLALGHAYTVLQVKCFPEHDLRMLQIRNPWGNASAWRGPWSAKDARWQSCCPEIAAACGHKSPASETAGDDGTFWIEWNDAKAFFSGAGACYALFGWHDYRIPAQVSHGAASVLIELHVDHETEIVASLSQPDRRGTLQGRYAALLLTLAAPDEPHGSDGKTANGHRYKMLGNASNTLDELAPSLTFISGRDLAFRTTLQPSACPYLLLCREYSGTTNVDATLAVLTKRGVGRHFSMTVKRMPRTLGFLDNEPVFDYDPSAAHDAADCHWQHRVDGNVPRTHTGARIA